MTAHRPGRLQAWTPLLFALVLITGMTLGFNLRDTLRNKRDIQAIIERNDRLEEIIDLINEKYVDTVNTNLLYKDAVTGILSHLDPHTVYIAAEELQGVNEDLEGSFFGIGVEFSIIRDTIEVTSVIEEGPASRTGVNIGDKFIKVNDSLVAGIGITSEGIIKKLRGKQYSRVVLTLKDAMTGRLRNVPIDRDVVPIYSVDATLMLDNTTGYIKINRFSATTFDEFMKALKTLKSKGMQSLVLDLRDNPGGYLTAATQIADQFLNEDKLLVYTQGRRSPRTDYKAGEAGLFEKGNLSVLVDENSASASEILAGAIQDWDRGLIIGRRTFGKGLVQEQYDLDDGSALRLTVAKYYTPSGRSIQRSFAQGKEAYASDFEKRFSSGELTGKDSVTLADTTRYYTANHRVVYGGGGIKPDIYVPYDTARLSSGILTMLFSDNLKNILWDYYTTHAKQLRQYKTVGEFNQRFTNAEEILNSYVNAQKGTERAVAERILKMPANKAYFLTIVKAQVARVLFRSNGYYAITSQQDSMVQKAVGLMRERKYSEIISR